MEKADKGGRIVSVPMDEIENPFFSIIVPVYNVETYLEKCVHSLLGQEKMDGSLEILLIDDGSTDGSGALCDRMASEFLQVRAFHKENGGPSSARNLGIRSARGEYIIFVDSDDHVERNMCNRLLEVMRVYGKPDMVSFDGVEHEGGRKSPMRRIPLETEQCVGNGRQFLIEHYKERNLNVEVWLYAYRNKFLREQDLWFQEGKLHEDVEFTPGALLVCGKILKIPDCFYHYMVHENSICTQKNKEKNIRDLFEILRKQCAEAEEQPPELKKWMRDAALNRYLNMVYYARMYEPRYRKLLDKRFLLGKAATNRNRFRVLICFLNVRLYCWMNDCYKKVKS